MTLKNYQNHASRTMVDLGSLELNLSHMILGLVSENEEYLKALALDDVVGSKEETADQFWYIANYCTLRNFDMEEIYNDFDVEKIEDWELEVATLDVYVSKLADYVKKFVAYGKELDPILEKRALGTIMEMLILENGEFILEIDLQKNIDKLKARFPNKFTQEKALNRDLETERKILES